MAEHNPYAPSQASLAAPAVDAAAGTSGVWRDGKDVVMATTATLPHRCVKCNELAADPTKARKVYWHHPLLYLLILLNMLLYAIVAVIVRKKAIVDPGLCAQHKKRRTRWLIIAWTGSLGGIVVIFAGEASPLGIWGSLVGVVMIIASIVVGLIFARIVYPSRIDKEYVRLRGCGADFLDSLPAFRG